MDYKETIYMLTLTILAVVGLPLLAHLVVTASAFLRSKAAEIRDKHTRELIEQAITVVEQVVLYVMQTYVDGLKQMGSFDKDAQKTALIEARMKAKALISEEARNAIEEGYGDFAIWLDTRIEQTVRDNKK